MSFNDREKIIDIREVAKKKAAAKKAKESKSDSKKNVYQLKITLEGFKPAIYRTVLVPDTINLNQLHMIIQESMGWTNSHLHDFSIKERRYTEYFESDDEDDQGGADDDHEINLAELELKEKDKFMYQYDFGDSWEHTIKLEKILPYDSSVKYPVCTKGAMKCPPEDVGGIWGYAEFLEKVSDPDDEEYEEMLDWVGEDSWNPEEFDLKKVNKVLAKLKIK